MMSSDPGSRRYRKKKRAQKEQDTRRRITEAAMQLHGTVGPANTAVTEVARLAGVSRMTVYNHFPTDADLFTACSTHWAEQNPFPDPSKWRRIGDPIERLTGALRELYRWYALKESMLGKVLRDAPVVPALGDVMNELWRSYVEGVVETLTVGWPPDETDTRALKAALTLAVGFDTWRVLTGEGLDDEGAAALAARMVIAGAPTPASIQREG